MSEREAAIRERFCWPTDDPDVTWLLAELAAAREREAKLREALRDALDAVTSQVPGGAALIESAMEDARAALADGEGEA